MHSIRTSSIFPFHSTNSLHWLILNWILLQGWEITWQKMFSIAKCCSWCRSVLTVINAFTQVNYHSAPSHWTHSVEYLSEPIPMYPGDGRSGSKNQQISQAMNSNDPPRSARQSKPELRYAITCKPLQTQQPSRTTILLIIVIILIIINCNYFSWFTINNLTIFSPHPFDSQTN